MMHDTYGFHDVLSWGADFQGMMNELSVICKVCADLALFRSKNLSVMIRRPELELTVGTLWIAISVRLSGERLFTYPR
jgi:hypothetical protein